uniref:Uncharacterized protein n=1 Tax=Arundo donax TaxID=35708 RepID=A0A0A9CBJ2_ARUDO
MKQQLQMKTRHCTLQLHGQLQDNNTCKWACTLHIICHSGVRRKVHIL